MSRRPALLGWRIGGLASGIAFGGSTLLVVNFGTQIGSLSPLLWGAAILSGLAAGAAITVALLPRSRLEAVRGRMQDGIAQLAEPEQRPRNSPLGYGLMAAAGVAAAINLTIFLRQADDPRDDDQGAYLQTAAEIHEGGGPAGLLRDLWRGEFSEANRHPLYLGLLSLRPSIGWGRTVSCVCGVAAAVLGTVWIARRDGTQTAGLFAILTATNGAWLFFSSRVYCESLLVLTSLLAWLISAPQGPEPYPPAPPDSGSLPGRPGGLWRAGLLGGTLGLTWLTKGSGLLLLAGSGLAIAVNAVCSGSWFRGGQRVCCLMVGFLVLASPLIVRNLTRYGSPFYNINSQLLFVDAYVDPTELAEQQTVGEAARQYWDTHTLGEMLQRGGEGLVWEFYVFLRSFGPAPLDDGRILCGVPVALCAGLGLILGRGLPVWTTMTWSGLLIVFFAWYAPIALGERFLAPLLLPGLALAGIGLDRLLRARRIRAAVSDRKVVVLGWLWSLGWSLTTVLVLGRA